MRSILLAALSLTLACSPPDSTRENGGGGGGGGKADDLSASGSGPRYAPGQVIVRVRPGVATVAGSVARFRRLPGVHVVKVAPGRTVESAVAELRADPDVLFAEPNYLYSVDEVPDDRRFGELWGLSNTGQTGGVAGADIGAVAAWDVETGSPDTVIALIDSGIDYRHPDLAANVWVNPGEIAGNKIDDDANGYIDDIHGINAITRTGDPLDDLSHGTHCAGTIAAVGDNGVGVAGVNWAASIVACKIFDENGDGATLEVVLRCMDYVLDLKTRAEHPVDIVGSNNSWGGEEYSEALYEAIEAHGDAGMLFIAAAGNDSDDNDLTPHFPSSYDVPSLVSVMSTTAKDKRSGFSNDGRYSVDVAAPGSGILSTVPGNKYGSKSGTSMATPHVTGLMGLIKSHQPELTMYQIRNLILTGGREVPAAANTVSGRRIRAWDELGGSLNCADSAVRRRLSPPGEAAFVAVGRPVRLEFLSVNCERAVPESITVAIGDDSIELIDADGSGTYRGSWTPDALGESMLAFSTGEIVPTAAVPAYRSPLEETFNFRAITGESITMTDDDSIEIASPFPLLFGGRDEPAMSIIVGSNGTATVTDPEVVKSATGALPAGGFGTLIAPMWTDLDPSKGGAVHWQVIGEAPARELVIEWRDIPHFDYGDAVTFQIVLFEGSADVVFNYKDVMFGDPEADGGAAATIGIQVAPNLAERFSSFVPSLTDGVSYRWRLDTAD